VAGLDLGAATTAAGRAISLTTQKYTLLKTPTLAHQREEHTNH